MHRQKSMRRMASGHLEFHGLRRFCRLCNAKFGASQVGRRRKNAAPAPVLAACFCNFREIGCEIGACRKTQLRNIFEKIQYFQGLATLRFGCGVAFHFGCVLPQRPRIMQHKDCAKKLRCCGKFSERWRMQKSVSFSLWLLHFVRI